MKTKCIICGCDIETDLRPEDAGYLSNYGTGMWAFEHFDNKKQLEALDRVGPFCRVHFDQLLIMWRVNHGRLWKEAEIVCKEFLFSHNKPMEIHPSTKKSCLRIDGSQAPDRRRMRLHHRLCRGHQGDPQGRIGSQNPGSVHIAAGSRGSTVPSTGVGRLP